MPGRKWFEESDTQSSWGDMFKPDEGKVPSIFEKSPDTDSATSTIFNSASKPVKEEAKGGMTSVLEEKNHGEYQEYFDNITNEYNRQLENFKKYIEEEQNIPIHPDILEDPTAKHAILSERRSTQRDIMLGKSEALASFTANQRAQAQLKGKILPAELFSYSQAKVNELSIAMRGIISENK